AGGFTIIELMLSLVVLAIIVALGAPALMSFVVQGRMTSQINDLLADISLARNEAATRGVRVVVCASTNSTTASPTCSTQVGDWTNGRIVFVDVDGDGDHNTASGSTEILLKASPVLTGSSTFAVTVNTSGTSAAGPPRIQFRPYGGMAVAGNPILNNSATILSNALFTLCPVNGTGKQGRVLSIAMTGRPVISKVGC
ncbi:MAG TPA: GspH/FimT family pseudopilin, partial [Burkholderiales bacterium]|nr:GspH/FimT family pseudopilin [Burkholderiales bacterium]